MKFRLTYDGPLRSTQRDPERNQPNRLAEHKHHLRQCFHGQLKELWSTNQFLKHLKDDPLPSGWLVNGLDNDIKRSAIDVIPDQYRRNGYRFLPLVRNDWSLLCEIDVLFLRRGRPGRVTQAGDLDNRVKTLIDGLRIPKGEQELSGVDKPAEGEDPFYCLLEDDNQVTSLSVETDRYLSPDEKEENNNRVNLIVTVAIKPFQAGMFNLGFL